MKKRTYTISNVLGKMDTPLLRMSGKWLIENGFEIGDKLKLIESKNMIILAKIPKQEVEMQQRTKEIKIMEKQIDYLKTKITKI